MQLQSINSGLILFWLCVAEFKSSHNSIKPCCKHNNQTQFIFSAIWQFKEPWWLYCPAVCRRHITFEQVWLNSCWLPLCLPSCWAPRWHNSAQHIYLHMPLMLIRMERNRLEIQNFSLRLEIGEHLGCWHVPVTGFLSWFESQYLFWFVLYFWGPDSGSLQSKPCLNAQILSFWSNSTQM